MSASPEVLLRRKIEAHFLSTARDEDGWLSNVTVQDTDDEQAQVELRGYESIDVQHLASDVIMILKKEGYIG